MQSSEPRKPRRVRRMALGLLALGAAFLGWMFRDCGLGLGSGLGGWGIGPDEQTARELLAPTTDAGSSAQPQPPRAPIDARPGPCQLFIDSAGLKLDGAPATIEDAVRACRATGKARLEVTGGARAGTYDELKRALEQAGISPEGE
ncbi:MAG TPA: hypothetical protein VNM90_14380 [Haliangium sp.]|nr:hypothetical protein [Haliangium sp.]